MLLKIKICWRILCLVIETIYTVGKLSITYFVPSWRHSLNAYIASTLEGTPIIKNEDNYKDSIFTLTYMKSFWYARYNDCFRIAEYMKKAQNVAVVTKYGKIKKLLDFQQNGRPLVINFGSCT